MIFGGSVYFFLYSADAEPAYISFVGVLLLGFLALGVGMMFRVAKTLSSTTNRISIGKEEISFDSIDEEINVDEIENEADSSDIENSNS